MDWPILDVLPPEDRARLLRETRRRRFARDEVVFHEGDPADTLHLLVSGRVLVRVTTELGDRATLAVLGAGQIVGELALVSPDGRRSATVVALEPTETLALHRGRFDDLRRQLPGIDRFLVQLLADHVTRLSAHLLEALYTPVDKRVLRRVEVMADEYGGGRAGTVIPLTQDHVAAMAGTTRATANRVLRAAEARGFLRVARGKVELIDPAGLARAAR